MCLALGLHASAIAASRLESLRTTQPELSSTDLAIIAIALLVLILSVIALARPSYRNAILLAVVSVGQSILILSSHQRAARGDMALVVIGAALACVLLISKHRENPDAGVKARQMPLRAGLLFLIWGVWIIGRVAMLQGFVVPARVAGASMAPSLHGIEFDVQCLDCGFIIAFDAENPSTHLEHMVCPNCGYELSIETELLHVKHGERVLIDRAAYWSSAPQRWQTIATNSADGFVVKRVAGLPTEEIAIRQGELFINGHWQRKTLDECRLVAQLVHDSAFTPRVTKDLADRWEYSKSGDVWSAIYHSSPCFGATPRAEESPITDYDPYNQGTPRALNRVHDLLLDANLTVDGNGTLSFVYVADDGERRVHVDLSKQQVQIQSDHETLAEQPILRPLRLLGQHTWEFAFIDGQITLACDGTILITSLVEQDLPTAMPGERPLAIRAEHLDVTAQRLRVSRDIYFLASNGLSAPWQGPKLGADEFFLLGDNVPVSRDSRHWGPVKRQEILGKVVRWR